MQPYVVVTKRPRKALGASVAPGNFRGPTEPANLKPPLRIVLGARRPMPNGVGHRQASSTHQTT